MTHLSDKKCKPCEGGVAPLDSKTVHEYLKHVSDWELDSTSKIISKTFKFKNFYHTMGFANAIAWIANQENHHPDLQVTYQRCTVSFTTHAINGLSENDFICAAKVDRLIRND